MRATVRLLILSAPILFAAMSLASVGHAANVFVPSFDVTSKADLDAELQTRAKFQLAFDGGQKYQAKVAFQYYNLDVQDLAVTTNPYQALTFDGLQAGIRGIFSFLDLTYWTGFYGVQGESKHYRGPLYFPWNGFDYDGYYVVTGTGLILTGNIAKGIASDLFVYQRSGANYIDSADLTFRVARGPVTFGLFTGVSDQVFRLGTQFVYVGNEIEFYLTAGNLSIGRGYTFDSDDFFFLAEEWFKMGSWDLVLSAFTRPTVHYNYVNRVYAPTGEQGDIDFNFDMFYTSKKGTFSPGTEFNIRSNSTDDLVGSIGPYVSVYNKGLAWKFKVDFKFPNDGSDLFTAYINLQASF